MTVGNQDDGARTEAPGAAWSAAGLLLIAAVAVLCIYRALTQAITHDEALTWQWYASGGIGRAFASYNANNHVLYSLLVGPSVSLFGTTEFALRLPAILGTLLYLVSAWRLCRLALGRGAFSLIALGLLTLNPLVLDFLVAARGYSLAMGFFLWGLFNLMRWLGREGSNGLLLRVSLAFGLSTVSHLTFALPSLAVALTALAWAVPGDKRHFGRTLLCLALPGTALAAALWLPSMLRAEGIKYVYGRESLLLTSIDLVTRSLAHHESEWLIPTASQRFIALVGVAARLVGLALVLLSLGVLRVVMNRPRGPSACSPAERLVVLATCALVFSLGVFVAAHNLIGALYPTDRWGLYMVLLFSLAVPAALLAGWRAGGWRRPASTFGGLVLCVALAQFVVQVQTTHFAVWILDAGSRRFMELVVERESRFESRTVRLEAMHWRVVPSLNFYRASLDARSIPEIPMQWDTDAPDPDYLVVVPQLFTEDVRARFKVIDTDPVSQTSLAVRR